MELSTTPESPIYRALPSLPLNWVRTPGRPVDGEVKKTVNKNASDTSDLLRAQPSKQGRYIGVSFFSPFSEKSNAIHNYFGSAQGCAVTVPNASLPAGLRFVHDGTLELPLEGGERVPCGEHYTLFASSDMPVAAFEAGYKDLLEKSTVPCKMEAGAQPTDLQLDMDFLPTDKLVRPVVMALDELNLKATDPNVRGFAKLYALHLRAKDMSFEELLRFGPMAMMAATALEAWTVRDGFLMASACKAQELLAEALECEVARPAYEPHFIHPFNFLDGQYNDNLYDKEANVCAGAFKDDKDLKAKVGEAAQGLFEKLAARRGTAMVESCSLLHRGITFRVNCAMRKDSVPAPSSPRRE